MAMPAAGHLDRLAARREGLADDARPFGQHARLGEAATARGRVEHLAEQVGQAPQAAAAAHRLAARGALAASALLAHPARPVVHRPRSSPVLGWGILAARTGLPAHRFRLARAEPHEPSTIYHKCRLATNARGVPGDAGPGDRPPARLVRPASPAAALAGRARAPPGALSRALERGHAAADHGGDRGRTLRRPSWRGFRPRLARRGNARPTSCMPGRASATTGAPVRLHACAKAVARAPWRSVAGKRGARCARCPGIGAYTARAILAIAFDRRPCRSMPTSPRVLARRHGIETPLPEALKELQAPADALASLRRPGDVAQALMDLGAMVCRPRAAALRGLPLAVGLHRACGRAAPSGCRGVPPRRERPVRRGLAFLLTRQDGAILFRRRPESGLLGGLHELPGSPWLAGPLRLPASLGHAPVAADWRLARRAGDPRLHPFRPGVDARRGAHRAAAARASGARRTGCTSWRCRR